MTRRLTLLSWVECCVLQLLIREGVIFWPSVLRRGARVAATQAKHFVIYVLD